MSKSITVITELAGNQREVAITVGGRYRVEPLNPRASKNRGRVCEVLKFGDSRDDNDTDLCTVRFEDTNRKATLETGDLVHLDE